jgi:hypothetical protein
MRRPAPDLFAALAIALLAGGCGHTGAAAAPDSSGAVAARVDLPALPPPDRPGAMATGPFAAFLGHALANAAKIPPGKLRESALIDQQSLATAPRRARCREQKPAVLLDLDPGAAAFDLDDPPSPAPGLAAGLARLRVSGIRVLWTASLPQADETQLRTILRATELDPDGGDLVLLLSRDADRKQLARLAAARDWCIVAVAGDRRADFDESYDYLRDPDGPVARLLDGNLGAGWFLTPLPIG